MRLNIKVFDHVLIMFLDHQPLSAFTPRPAGFHMDQCEIAVQPLSVQTEFEIALLDHRRRFGFGSG